MLAVYIPHAFNSVVLMAPAAVLKDDSIKGNLMGIHYDPKHIPDTIEFMGRKLGSFYFSIAQTLPIFEVSSQYKGPVCLIHGKQDSIVPYFYSEQYHSIYSDSTLHLLETDDHGFNIQWKEAVDIAVKFMVEEGK